MQKQEIKKILFPTDFSVASDYALSYAVSMAKRFKAEIFLIHVVDTSYDISGFYIPHISVEKLIQEMESSAEAQLKKVGGKISRSVKAYKSAVKSGIPYKEIIKFAKNKGIDMIIMGTHGKSGTDHFFFGSTTERVMKQADCPVLTIRPPKDMLLKGRE
ncbi:MAG: universal stress protein [Deltaproteobacteria bacterium]|nr:universal stress protein [Deltaproteobacteria bacterium]